MQIPKLKLSDISPKAVIAGAIVDNAGTLLIMTLLAAGLVSTGLTEDEVMKRMRSTDGLLLGLIIGLGYTVLGGFIAGWMAKRYEVLHGALVAVVGMVLTLVFQDEMPKWFDIVGLACMLPAGMIGGHFAASRRKRIGQVTP